MNRIVITIFALPHELDDLERLLVALSSAARHVDGQAFEFNVIMSLSDSLTDWKSSTLRPDFFLARFTSLKKLTDWAGDSVFQVRDDVLGCVSARRVTHEERPNASHFLWIDPDICFDQWALRHLLWGLDIVNRDSHCKMYVLCPDTVRRGDASWDILVSDKYSQCPLGYSDTNNPFTDCGQVGTLEVRIVRNDIAGQPIFKFGGGWFTCVSKPLLDRIPLRAEMGHYGLDDTYLMWGMEFLHKRGELIDQFNLHNYVVCENVRYRDRSYFDLAIKRIDRKEEFSNLADAVVWDLVRKL